MTLPSWHVSDYLPDESKPSLQDIAARNIYTASSLEPIHPTLAVSQEWSQTVDTTQRIRNVQIGAVSGGTVTIQVQVDGADIFDDAERPTSGGEVKVPSSIYNFPAGSVVKTIIEATSGAPTGTATAIIDTETFVLRPILPKVRLSGKDRLFVSRRRLAEADERGVDIVAESAVTHSTNAYATPSGVLPSKAQTQKADFLRRTGFDAATHLPPRGPLGGRPPRGPR